MTRRCIQWPTMLLGLCLLLMQGEEMVYSQESGLEGGIEYGNDTTNGTDNWELSVNYTYPNENQSITVEQLNTTIPENPPRSTLDYAATKMLDRLVGRTACSLDQLKEICRILKKEKTLICDKRDAVPEWNCVFQMRFPVQLVIFQRMSLDTGALDAFAYLSGLQKFVFEDMMSVVSMKPLLERVPRLKEIEFIRTHVLDFQKVHAYSELSSIRGLEVGQLLSVWGRDFGRDIGSISQMQLSHLRSLQIEIGCPRLIEFLDYASLEKLDCTLPNHTAFRWSELLVNRSSLQTLNLRMPKITGLPEPCPFPNLELLELTTNRAVFSMQLFNKNAPFVRRFDENDTSFHKLKELRLDSFRIATYQPMKYLPNLEIVRVNNLQGTIGNFNWENPNLRELYVTYGHMSLMNSDLFRQTMNIQVLSVQHSRVKFMTQKALTNLPKLRVLNLAGNLLPTFTPNLQAQSQLRQLDLSYNRVVLFPAKIVLLPKLEAIDLSHNLIIGVESAAIMDPEKVTPTLKHIDLEDNPLQCDCNWVAMRSMVHPQCEWIANCSLIGYEVELEKVHINICDPLTKDLRFKRNINVSEVRKFDERTSVYDFFKFGRNLTQERKRFDELAESMIEGDSTNFIRPEVGVGFKSIHYLLPNIESLFLHVLLDFPALILPGVVPFEQLSALEQVCTTEDSLITAVCEDYLPLIQLARTEIMSLREQVVNRFSELETMFESPVDYMSPNPVEPDTLGKTVTSNPRAKRRVKDEFMRIFDPGTTPANTGTPSTPRQLFYPEAWSRQANAAFITSIFLPQAGSAMNSNLGHRRSIAFMNAFHILSGRTHILKQSQLDLRSDLNVAFALVADIFSNVTFNMNSVVDLINSTNLDMEELVSSMSKTFNIYQQKIQSIRILSALGSRYLHLWNVNLNQYKTLKHSLEKVIEAVGLLQLGKLSHEIFPPTAMKEAIRQGSQALRNWDKDYGFVFSSLAEFYTHSEVVFIPIRSSKGGLQLLVQLKWPANQLTAPRYKVYHAQSLHVPVTTGPLYVKSESNHDYTRVMLNHPYLGVAEGKSFLELDTEDIQKCDLIQDTFYCDQNFLELDDQHYTCLTALYLNASAAIVAENCHVDYFFEPFKPKASIVDVGRKLLIVGLQQPFRFDCQDSKFPKDLMGAPYVLMDKEDLCGCSVASANGFISRRLSFCRSKRQPRLLLQYVHNELIQTIFPNLTDYNPFSVEDVLDTETSFSEPTMKTLKRLRNFRLRNSTTGIVKLQNLARLIEQKGEELEYQWNLLAEGMEFNSWFSSGHWPKAVAFCGAILGTISLVLSCYVCFAGCYGNGMAKSMMLVAAPQMARAMAPEEPTLEVDLSKEAIFKVTMSHVVIVGLLMLFVYCGKRLIRYCCRQANLLVIHPELRDFPKVEIYLEMHTGHERELLYLMTVRAPVTQLHYSGNLMPRHLNLDDHRWYSVLRPDWTAAQARLRVNDLLLDLPCLIAVPLNKKWKIRRMLQRDCSCVFIATDTLYLYRLEQNAHLVMDPKMPYAALIQELKNRSYDYLTNRVTTVPLERTESTMVPDIDGNPELSNTRLEMNCPTAPESDQLTTSL